MKSILPICALLLLLGLTSNALAACSIKTSAPVIGPVDSFALNSAPQGVMAGAGFYCTPELVALNSTNTLSATLSSANKSNGIPRLLNGAGDAIPYSVCSDASCSPAYLDGEHEASEQTL